MSITRRNPTVLPPGTPLTEQSPFRKFCVASGRTLWSLRKTLLLSTLLGLILVLIGGMQTPLAHPSRPVVWAICLCVALAYGKVISTRNPFTVAGFALLGIVASLVFNEQRFIATEYVELVRTLCYPMIGWSVCKWEQAQQKQLGKAFSWLFPLVGIPVVVGLLVAVKQPDPWKVLAEIVFAAGCGLILHLQTVPETNKMADSATL